VPTYVLHADYDRDGTVSKTLGELSHRGRLPGAILVANLDVDGPRRADNSGRPGPESPALDRDLAKKSPADNEIQDLVVTIVPGTENSAEEGALELQLSELPWVRVFDPSGNVVLGAVPGVSNGGSYRARLPLTFRSGSLRLRLEAIVLPVSPAVDPLLPEGPTSGPGTVTFELKHGVVGGLVREEKVPFTIAPLLFPDDTLPPRILFICTTRDNRPTVADVAEVIKKHAPTVKMVEIPPERHNGDSWIQDQVQIGYCYGPKVTLPVALHLPRLRSDTRHTLDASNLGAFVADYFPTRDRGLSQDLWERTLRFRDAAGRPMGLPLERNHRIFIAFARVWNTVGIVDAVLDDLRAASGEAPASQLAPSITAALRRLNDVDLWLSANLERVLGKVKEEPKRASLRARATDARLRIPTLDQFVELLAGRGADGHRWIRVTMEQNEHLHLVDTEADRIDEELARIHDSTNYGGNVEVSPPVAGAPWGKLVLGTTSAMDPALVTFLQGQGRQPIVDVDTSWLEIGHVDEVVAFVPHRNRGFCALVASPGRALELLREALAAHIDGLPEGHPAFPANRLRVLDEIRESEEIEKSEGVWRYEGYVNLDGGKHPVTDLLRGRRWLHQESEKSINPLLPPRLYRVMAEHYGTKSSPPRDTPLNRGLPVDAQYPAAMSIREFFRFEPQASGEAKERRTFRTNAQIEKEFITKLRKQLGEEFENIPVHSVPVLFDVVRNLAQPTVAFTPDLVNLQVLNNHVLVPRPYGPRMHIDSAVLVLDAMMRRDPNSHQAALRLLTKSWLRDRGLVNSIHWAKQDRGGPSDLEDVAREFKDGFRSMTGDDVAKRIKKANAGKFNPAGDLGPGWHRLVIPDGTVDLFEAYTQLVIEACGPKVHWVDTWFYHVRLGGLHCGTNVLRAPHQERLRRWWAMKAPARKMDFGGGDTIEAGPRRR
jgi:hypothetical protein